MRSRYTAYVLGHQEYLLSSWSEQTRPANLGLEPDRRWLGLKIKRTVAGDVNDTEGEVEFVARSKLGSKADRLHEISRFTRESGRWVYVDGDPGQSNKKRH